MSSITIGTVAAVVGAGAAVAGAVAASKSGKAPAAPAVTPPPQGAQAPDASASLKKNANGAAGLNAGTSSTFLTGPSGIDSGSLNIGKNVFLGQ